MTSTLARAAQVAGGAKGRPGLPHFKPTAKRVLCLFQSGGLSHVDLFDDKPMLHRHAGQEIPASVKGDQRLTGMTSNQSAYPVVPPLSPGKRCGPQGTWISDLLPNLQTVAGDLCIIRSLHTEAINHDPAITFMQTGSQLAGRPSIGAWSAYGLGSENADLPAYVVMTSFGSGRPADQPLYDRLWGAGFLPSKLQGVKLRNKGERVLYLKDPEGIPREVRREQLDEIAALNNQRHGVLGDPEIQTRISQYEMAFRMQTSVPDLLDLSKEPQHVLDLYGPDVKRPGSYASNCLLARRLCERDVRFIQLFHMGWDHHGGLPKAIKGQCNDTDQATAGLLTDLKQRGLLDDTLIVWGGEFGRTTYSQGALTETNYGRDHHPRCFTVLMAGAGVNKGTTYGETDDFSYNIVKDGVHVHDLNATILHLMGVEHTRLTYRYQGRDFRLTDIHGEVVKKLLA